MTPPTYADLKADLRLAYDRAAGARAAMTDEAWKQAERVRFAGLLRGAGAATLLEVGAGHGVSGRYFADQGFDVTCVDLSPELVARCRAKGLAAQVMDFAELDFPAGSFDAGFAMNCLLHVPRAELDRVLRTFRRVLRPGALCYWGQYTRDAPFEGVYDNDRYQPKRFFSVLSDAEIQQTAARVFEVVDFRRLGLDRENWDYQAVVVRCPLV